MGRKSSIRKDDKFGYLKVIEVLPSLRNGVHTKGVCLCICGNITIVSSSILKNRIKSCGCRQYEKGKVSKLKGISKYPPGVAAKNAYYSDYRISARRRKLSFSLTREEFESLIGSNCYYCGQTPTLKKKNRAEAEINGIDRVDPSIGYIYYNCVPCCSDCNFAKLGRSKKEFLIWISRVYCYSKIGKLGM